MLESDNFLGGAMSRVKDVLEDVVLEVDAELEAHSRLNNPNAVVSGAEP